MFQLRILGVFQTSFLLKYTSWLAVQDYNRLLQQIDKTHYAMPMYKQLALNTACICVTTDRCSVDQLLVVTPA